MLNITALQKGFIKKGLRVILGSSSDRALCLCSTLLKNMGCTVKVVLPAKAHKTFEDFTEYISKLVILKHMDIGVILDENGENIILVDNKGFIIEPEKYSLISSLILLKSDGIKELVVPCTVPMSVEKLACKYKADVKRSKSSSAEIASSIDSLNDNNDKVHQFIMHFDGIGASAKIARFILETGLSLHEHVKDVPNIFTKRSEILCDFKDRGRIIRSLIEANKGGSIELLEGVKINTEKGWTLVLPDNEKPVFKVFTEGFSEEYANELSDSIVCTLNSLLNNRN
jgi:mannose-1-phosphate guanylyltransferase/phosphomannomutase